MYPRCEDCDGRQPLPCIRFDIGDLGDVGNVGDLENVGDAGEGGGSSTGEFEVARQCQLEGWLGWTSGGICAPLCTGTIEASLIYHLARGHQKMLALVEEVHYTSMECQASCARHTVSREKRKCFLQRKAHAALRCKRFTINPFGTEYRYRDNSPEINDKGGLMICYDLL